MAKTVYNIRVKTIDGKEITLNEYAGKTLLIVNVASKCGFTPQYEDLERLYKQFHGQGLEILGFPTNDFLKQEPGNDQDIANFCSLTYGVTFPMFSKITVRNEDQHPLYKFMTEQKPVSTHLVKRSALKNIVLGLFGGKGSEVQWNFEKFLISPQGTVVARWASEVKPMDAAIVNTIKSHLPKA